MVIRTPHAAPDALAHALTVLRLGRELLDDPALTRRLAADPDARLTAIAAATLSVPDRRPLLPLGGLAAD